MVGDVTLLQVLQGLQRNPEGWDTYKLAAHIKYQTYY